MTSPTKLSWCAMLSKLVAPMDPERAAKAFADMLPMLPEDDDLYTRSALERAAKIDRKTAVPTFEDLSAALAEEWRGRLPVAIRMGASPAPALPTPTPREPTDAEAAHVTRRVDEAKAILAAAGARRDFCTNRGPETARPRHVSKLELGLAEQRRGVPIERIRPDWRAALEAHAAAQDRRHDPE